MSIAGRIDVDVLFHDTDGTASLKVVSLQDSQPYTSGKVAIVTGTIGTALQTVAVSPTSYRDSSGSLVSFSAVTRIAFRPTADASFQDAGSGVLVNASGGSVSCFSLIGNQGDDVQLGSLSGTASYTLVLYGT